MILTFSLSFFTPTRSSKVFATAHIWPTFQINYERRTKVGFSKILRVNRFVIGELKLGFQKNGRNLSFFEIPNMAL